jgi:hypothetical protein
MGAHKMEQDEGAGRAIRDSLTSPPAPHLDRPFYSCLQYNDNAPNVRDEVMIWLINQSGGTVRAGAPATFTIAVNTLGQP